MQSRGVIHRDLKLANILITPGNKLKIIDFGLAVKLTDFNEERQTLCGTPNYIPPEVLS
jgi:serine/threonine protein kinase